jgi:osmoprotectant transport system ATP-binding protein
MIRLDGVSKKYDDGTIAVHDLGLDVPEGETVVLVGPSGCGKSTTLKMVNRLIEPSGGRILLGGEDVTHVDPVRLRRRMGYVIQQTGLFPHQNIAANVATVPKLLGWDRKKVDARVHELLELVGLDPKTYARRYPHQLSGGQRQRVGVARALAADPPVLLMDEPFGAVDPIVRERLQGEFIRLQREVRKTVLFVTHDLDEAVRMGDRIAVFSEGGHLEQYDAPARLLGSPATDFVASFVGADRGLKRLSVTPIEKSDLEHPPVVHTTDRVADARASLRAAGARWGVVLDDENRLHGWVSADEPGDGTVADRARRMEAWVPVGANLKMAFAEMLQHDAGWVAVLDGDRYVGVLTPATLHEALRRSVESDVLGVEPEDVELDRVPTV